ncbi:MAG: methylated-DNA--[protein]-cysteine S-methyltransferase [Erysipelothrix sp.]|nr:methylated-DNA--[protein]-cysteine S-methyltransferase [Erysipelothrix sp.]
MNCVKYDDLLIPVIINVEDEKVVDLFFDTTMNVTGNETAIHQQCYQELKQYFNKERTTFDVPFQIEGTDFQQIVYRELLNIEYGTVISYKELAKRVNRPKAFRAVGNANGKNRIPIIIPCHRVISNSGTLGGYSGGSEIKKILLGIEGVKL